VLSHEGEVLLALDAFGHVLRFRLSAMLRIMVTSALSSTLVRARPDERAVDLDRVDRQARQVAEAGIPVPKSSMAKRTPRAFKGVMRSMTRSGSRMAMDSREFQFEKRRRQADRPEYRRPYRRNRLLELFRRDVDGEGERVVAGGKAAASLHRPLP
jgi:hypothetical protein